MSFDLQYSNAVEILWSFEWVRVRVICVSGGAVEMTRFSDLFVLEASPSPQHIHTFWEYT